MTNLLVNVAPTSAPQAAGRALFSARPAAAVALPDQAQVASSFQDALRGAQDPAPELVDTSSGYAAFARQSAQSPTQLTGEALDVEADDVRGEPQIALLPSIAPTPATQVTAAIVPVAVPAVVSDSHVEIPATVSQASAPVLSAATVAVVVPTVLRSVSAPERASSNGPLSNQAGALPIAATANNESIAAALAAAATPAGSSAVRGANAEAVMAGAERSMMLLAAQAHAFALSPVAVKEPAAAEAVNQAIVASKPSLAAVLGERLHVQINQRSEHAVIRLDPPSMGTIEIVVRHEAGGVQVQMRASNPEVARQLHGIGDTLRQDLVQRQHGDVSVQVWDGSRDADGRQRQRSTPWQDEPGHALRETADEHEPAAFALNASE